MVVSSPAGVPDYKLPKGNDVIELTVDSVTAYHNGSAIKLDIPPKILGSRVVAPIRFLCEGLGCQVEWEGSTSTISITS